MITFIRRRALGAGSVRGLCSWFNSCEPRSIGVCMHKGLNASVLRNNKLCTTQGFGLQNETSLLVRWGCTSQTRIPIEKQLNISSAIQRVNDKQGMRELLSQESPEVVPLTISPELTRPTLSSGQWIVRPRHHAQGRNVLVADSIEEVLSTIQTNPTLFANGWYASELIDKVAEYRVYVGSGRVVSVARKHPDDPTQVAWNVARGGRFEVVRWGEWPMEAVRVALEAFKHSGLDFSGVDVMIDDNGRAYVIELNSAPSLPLLSDGSRSYRQTVMAKYFNYVLENGKEHFPECQQFNHWSDCIHPCVQMYNEGD